MASQGKEGYEVSEQRIDCEFKVVLIGDFEVGKCQILARCERKESKTGTVTVKYETQTLHIEKKNYKDANGVILVYDITNRKSFDCMTLCLEELHRHAKKRQAIILIGNKSDSENDREVLRKEARGFAEKNDLIFWEISALEGTNFEDANGVILVYDITNRKSFDCMTLCLEELHRHAKKRQAIILIGNKSDSENDREVLRKEARGFAEKNDLIFWEISALEGTNFDNALKDLLTNLRFY
ncbi:ras-related protein rab11a [Quercus suber]|uniref:Ras-related protein rab11a n=1 Tax=Quercus suber TaxID=58331 RepID=A0AAW0JUB2_QUESU